MTAVQLHPTRCAICKTEGNATELYPANFEPDAFNPEVFSARRLPDRIHYRMVKCNTCGLVRSDPVAETAKLTELYQKSSFDYGDEVANLRFTYRRYLDRVCSLGARKGCLLEIGCGNGFFLEEAKARGFSSVHGVEPSAEAFAKAAPGVRNQIVFDIMRPGLFPEASQAWTMSKRRVPRNGCWARGHTNSNSGPLPSLRCRSGGRIRPAILVGY